MEMFTNLTYYLSTNKNTIFNNYLSNTTNY